MSITLEEELEDMISAEEFLDYFDIEYDPTVIQVNRLHIMQRYHDYLEKAGGTLDNAEDDQALRTIYCSLLQRAYQDFVESDALTEKVFKVFRMNEPQTAFVSVDQLLGP